MKNSHRSRRELENSISRKHDLIRQGEREASKVGDISEETRHQIQIELS